MKVVFPAPFGPSTPKIVPPSTCKDSRSTATVWRAGERANKDVQPDWWLKILVRSTASMAIIGGCPQRHRDSGARSSSPELFRYGASPPVLGMGLVEWRGWPGGA